LYRLRVVTLDLPPLREHKDDIPMLAESFLAQFGARHNRKARLSRAALDLLVAYDWPGNVRELRNAIERSLVLSRGDEIAASDLPEEVRESRPPTAGAAGPAGNGGENAYLAESDFREARRQFEIVYLKRKLEEHRWNVSKTAAVVGLHRQSLQEKLRELGIQRPGK
jgi:two-component system nitrogen regulation response regulator NtrX